jgi:methionyl aminopeptidase
MGHTESYPFEPKNARELDIMRRAGRLLQRIMLEVAAEIRAGATTIDLDRMAEKKIREAGARPAFKNKYGYPYTICASVNEAVIHGFPTRRRLAEGDIVGLDCGLVLEGFYADTALTVPVGTISPEAQRLLRVTRECLDLGISQARVGNRVGDISQAIYDHARANGYHPAENYTGHGIGRNLHEDPQVPNTPIRRLAANPRLVPGMVIAIEPMLNVGTGNTRELKDGWTVVTADGSLSAHFEHTVAITAAGPEILTKGPEAPALAASAPPADAS